MFDPNYCPFCKCSVSYEISKGKNHRLIKCENCGYFVTSHDAEEYLTTNVVEKSLLNSTLFPFSSPDEYIYIYLVNKRLLHKTIKISEWSDI